MTVDEWLDQMTPDKIPGFNLSLEVITGIAVIIGFLVIFQSMYTAVLERTREIGILKSMGASKTTIVSVVLRECAVLAAAGVVVGILGTYGVQLIMAHFFPTHDISKSRCIWLALGAVDRLCGCVVWRALSRLDGCPQRSHRCAGVRIELIEAVTDA